MHNFNQIKKAIFSTLCILLIFSLFSFSIFLYVEKNDISLSPERTERLSYAGKIDFVTIGASHCQCAFTPSILDEKLGCFSYNLAQDSINNPEKLMLLENEFSRNPISTLVIEISYDTLTKGDRINYTDAITFFSNRLDNATQRITNLLRYTSFDNYGYVYSSTMMASMEGIRHLFHNDTQVDYTNSLKGGRLLSANDHSITEGMISESYDSIDVFSEDDINPAHLRALDDMIALAKKNHCRVIVVVVPVSDHYLWKARNLDNFNQWITSYCMSNDVEFYDFNLSKDRYNLFLDTESYSTDTHHMSKIGAPVFSELFCEILRKIDNKDDISEEFYKTYIEMKSDSPYWNYIVSTEQTETP